MLKPRMGVSLDRHILHRKLLPPRPPDHGFRDLDALLIQKRDGQQDGISWSHEQIARETPAGTGEIPDRALSLTWPRVVRDGALHSKASVSQIVSGMGAV